MSTSAENLLLEQLQKLDKEIAETDRALVHLNKQVGQKVSKLSDLNAKRRKISDAYKDLTQSVMNQPQEPVHGLTMRDVK